MPADDSHDPNELVNMATIAERLGASVQVVRWWRSEGKLPPADENPSPRVILWRWSTIAEWDAAGRPVGEPERAEQAAARAAGRTEAEQAAALADIEVWRRERRLSDLGPTPPRPALAREAWDQGWRAAVELLTAD